MRRRRRAGRPPKRPDVAPTRDRLLAASIEVFVECGFSQASVTDIAGRAGISGPAVYKHFDGKADLFIRAARHSLDSMLDAVPADGWDPVVTARRWLADDFAATRRLLLELHLAAGRDTDVADLLADWHLERTRAWQVERDDPLDRIKAFYLLLLGLAQVDALDALPVEPDELGRHVDRMVGALFTDPTDRS
jgi:AcrR family transcriptional regulator